MSNQGQVIELHPEFNRNQVFSGRLEDLSNITAFCRKVYHSAFGPEEGEQRFRKLPVREAVELWRAGLPESLTVR